MEIGLYIWNLKNNVLILLIFTIIFSCDQPEQKIDDTYDKYLVSGNIICRLGNGYFSGYFKEYASSEKKFSHIVIISKENDSVFVYHSEASEFTGVGFVKREPLGSFLNGINTFEFYKMKFSDSLNTKIIEQVKYYYDLKTPFDLEFNSTDNSKLYCYELIAISINKALVDSIIKPTLILNNKPIYGLDDIYLNKNVEKISLRALHKR